MNPLAKELNDTIRQVSPAFFSVLSGLGRELFFPRGILTQTAEARKSAHRFNATIGMATEGGEAMHLGSIMEPISGLSPDEALSYAPATGNPRLREAWLEEMLEKNPSLRGKSTSLPVVTSGITHGLTLAAEMFLDPGDIVLLPDKFWGNYRMLFEVKNGAVIRTYPFFSGGGTFNTGGLKGALQSLLDEKGKAMVVLNFPNNPTGYTVTEDQAGEVVEAIAGAAGPEREVVVVLDDAYFGLFYSEDAYTESLFGPLAGRSEHVFPVKLDGATKEEYVWGFRVGFFTLSVTAEGDTGELYSAVEKKLGGAIRGGISNCSQLSQAVLLYAMEHPDFDSQRREKYELMRSRALEVKKALSRPEFDEVWEPYPFNAGYFMCLRLKDIDGEEFRKRLLESHDIGVIATGPDIRIAFSCLELDQISDLFDIMYRCAKELKRN